MLEDQYTEQLVKGKPGSGEIGKVVIAALVITAGLVTTMITGWGLFLLAGGITLLVFAVRSMKFEYEYIIVNGDIDLTKIIAMTKRKPLRSISSEVITAMDSADSPKAKNDMEVGEYTVYDYTDGTENSPVYAIYTTDKGKKEMHLLQLSEKSLRLMKQVLKKRSLI